MYYSQHQQLYSDNFRSKQRDQNIVVYYTNRYIVLCNLLAVPDIIENITSNGVANPPTGFFRTTQILAYTSGVDSGMV